jgi:ribonuclease inhibitor
MKTIDLDGNIIKSKDIFYNELEIKLNLPDYFGRNLDALWECIADKDIVLPINIKFSNFQIFKDNVGDDFSNKVLSLFRDAQAELGDNLFYFEIK